MTTPTRAPLMPEPFGYVSDGFPDGLHFQHKPWPELHQLTHSVAAVYSAHTAGREQGLREAAAKVRTILADCEARDVDDPELEQVAQDIEQLRSD